MTLCNRFNLPQSGWITEAKGLQNETLVFLIREIRGGDEELFGKLVRELSQRTVRIAKRWPQDIDEFDVEDIVLQVEMVIFPVCSRDAGAAGFTIIQPYMFGGGRIENAIVRWLRTLKARLQETLPQSFRKKEGLHWWYAGLEVVIFLTLASSLPADLSRWLSGQAPELGFFRAGANLIACAASLLSWQYVKNSNRAAARAFQDEGI